MIPLVTEMIDKIDENGELMVVLADQLGLLVRTFKYLVEWLHWIEGFSASAPKAFRDDRKQ